MADKNTQITIKNPEILSLADWGRVALKAQILPAGMNLFQAISIIQAGKEIGLPPLQSLRTVSIIKGKLTMAVQLQLALARKGGVEVANVTEEDGSCQVTLIRGKEKITCKYTMDDAKRAGLVKEGGLYEKNPRQMFRWRAIGDGLRIIAPDCVLGLLSPEEAETLEFKPTPSDVVDAEFEVKGDGEPGEASPETTGEPRSEKIPDLDAATKMALIQALSQTAVSLEYDETVSLQLDMKNPDRVTEDDKLSRAEAMKYLDEIGVMVEASKIKEALFSRFEGDEDAVQAFVQKELKVKGDVPLSKISIQQMRKLKAALDKER